MVSHVYGTRFYQYICEGSRASANVVVPMMLANARIASVLDVGAGNGSWLAAWVANGVEDALAVDGAYVDTAQLVVPADRFHAHDLSLPLDLVRRFDCVQSLEVAEHIAEDHAEAFVDTLARHGDIVLFSAAVTNQGGEFHVNEQPPEYWRRKFDVRGYACFDWLRPQLEQRRDVKAWYRFNTLVYANSAGQERLSREILSCRLADTVRVPVRGNLAWHARRAMVSMIPDKGIHFIARAKAAIETHGADRA